MKRQNDNTSPGLGRGRLVPTCSSHNEKGNEFRYAVVRQFSRGDERIREDIHGYGNPALEYGSSVWDPHCVPGSK